MKKQFNLDHHDNGVILKIHHTIKESKNVIRRIKLTSASFSEKGKILACNDHRGNVFIFDFIDTVYWEMNLESEREVLSFLPRTEDILLITSKFDPFKLFLINIHTNKELALLMGHTCKPNNVSFSLKHQLAITSAYYQAIIWNLNNYTKYFMLNINDGPLIKVMEMIPNSDYIFGSFQNYTLCVWNTVTLEIVDNIPSKLLKNVDLFSFISYKRILTVSTVPSKLNIITLDTWDTIYIDIKIDKIEQINFTSNEYIKELLIISTQFSIYFYNLETATFVYDIPNKYSSIKKVILCPVNKYLACILNIGEIVIYELSHFNDYFKVKDLSCESNKYVFKKITKRDNLSLTSIKIMQNDEYKKTIENISSKYNKEYLKKILNYSEKFPNEHRKTVWKILLQMPRNKEAFNNLNGRTVHPSCVLFFDDIPKNIYFKNFQRVLSCLSYWNPGIIRGDFLKEFLFPFVKAFYNDPLFCFETCATVLINYCQYWFEYVPLPPIKILSIVENILENFDKTLLSHYYKYNISSEIYAWKLLKSGFSEVLLTSEWLMFWDHILTNGPSFLLLAVISYNLINKSTLLNLKEKQEFELFFVSQNPIILKYFIKLCYKLQTEIPKEINPNKYFKSFKSIDGTVSYIQDFVKIYDLK